LASAGGGVAAGGPPKRKSNGDAAKVVEIAMQIAAAAAIARSAWPGMFPAPANSTAHFIVGFSRLACLERVPIKWNHLIDKDALRIKELEHVLMRHRIYPMS